MDLRRELDVKFAGVAWKGHGDTETLVECIDAWGLETTLKKAVGMFAIAVWDRHMRVLSIARDRFGEKPLYYAKVAEGVFFASELKALQHIPLIDFELDTTAVDNYLALNYIPSPLSIFKWVKKLVPGCVINFDIDIEPRPYWQIDRADVAKKYPLDTFTDHELLELVEAKLTSSISKQMEADADVGAFLSGGMDSSLIVALMQEQSSSAVNTFTIGFEEPCFDERPFAQSVAMHLGTRHRELVVTSQDALNLIPNLGQIYDEPFGDCSQIPTFFASCLASKSVRVVLAGEGGDELFGGYRINWLSHGS